MNPIRIGAVALLVIAAGGCERGSDKANERDSAAGRILPASVGDTMLETDRFQIEAPVAEPAPADDKGEAKGPGKASAGKSAGASPKPGESPSPSPAPSAAAPTPEARLTPAP